jgi:hypothetical protein
VREDLKNFSGWGGSKLLKATLLLIQALLYLLLFNVCDVNTVKKTHTVLTIRLNYILSLICQKT